MRAELNQETGYDGDVDLHFVVDYVDEVSGFTYSNYLAVVEDEFTPVLNWEGADFGWFTAGEWPEGLHFGLAYLLSHASEPASLVNGGGAASSPAP